MIGVGLWAVTQKSDYNTFSSISTDPAAVMVAVGGFIFIISFFGTVGALRENICFLKTYMIVMIIIVILEVIAGLLAFAFWPEVGTLSFKLSGQLLRRIPFKVRAILAKIHMTRLSTVDGHKFVYCILQFQCCGSTDLNDWDINRYFKCGGRSPEQCGVPYSCCVRKLDERPNVQCGWHAREQHRLALKGKIYITGCLDAVLEWFRNHLVIVAAVAVAFAFPEVVGIIMTHLFIKQIKEQIEAWKNPQTFKYRPSQEVNGRSGPFY
ncbi:PREDICTED: tetraspanin-15-like [Acropora digitifera]|uniref:tetraspanin-15-like n=1 Tax=Acropora digitifera TaxID=70779 RepID=UPI00077ADA8E|nr:PREDICTED: tetraspanin-15-like [Acropora digitifera]